jgi:hypothetical protein
MMSDFERAERLMKTPTRELVEIEPSEWNETFSGIHGDDLRLLSNSLVQLSIKAARMAAYVDARGGEHHKDMGHSEGVNAQNETKVSGRLAAYSFRLQYFAIRKSPAPHLVASFMVRSRDWIQRTRELLFMSEA